MTTEQWSLLASFVTMALVASSYFLKNKRGYLLFQSVGMIFLMASYCLDGLYFPMIGLSIGLARALIFFAYEKKDKSAPIFWPYVLAALSVVSYLIVNVWILKTQNPYDILYLIGLILYAFAFRIRNLEVFRYTVTIPTAICLLYNVVSGAAIFAILSYGFELCANVLAILKYYVFGRQTKEKSYD